MVPVIARAVGPGLRRRYPGGNAWEFEDGARSVDIVRSLKPLGHAAVGAGKLEVGGREVCVSDVPDARHVEDCDAICFGDDDGGDEPGERGGAVLSASTPLGLGGYECVRAGFSAGSMRKRVYAYMEDRFNARNCDHRL